MGYSKIYNQFDLLEPEKIMKQAIWKRQVVKLAKKYYLVRALALTFMPGTQFVCIK